MIVVGNLKMYMTYEDVLNYKDNVPDDVIVCPSSIFVPYFLNHNYQVGVQDVSMYDLGSHTGDINAKQAKEMGVSYTIIGHSERRNKETDEEINKKIKKALENNLKVILCIGENKDEDKNKKLKYQLLTDLEGVDVENIIIAYEPIWCIGTGITPTNTQIEDTINFIKSIVNDNFKKSVKVLYGGSVDKNNIDTLKKIDNVAGFLIGKASTDCVHLKEIVDSLR